MRFSRAASLVALFLALALPARAAAATTTAITSLTLTPPTLASGRVYLTATGENIERYVVMVDCPSMLFMKSGPRNFCGRTYRLPAERLERLWLNLKNPNRVAGFVDITVQGLRPGEREPVVERSISLAVKAR